jgi:hypothetical protein
VNQATPLFLKKDLVAVKESIESRFDGNLIKQVIGFRIDAVFTSQKKTLYGGVV